MSPAEIATRFDYHRPTEEQQDRMAFLRGSFKGLAEELADSTPDSREKSLALTHLEQAHFYANAAIARREGDPIDSNAAEGRPTQ